MCEEELASHVRQLAALMQSPAALCVNRRVPLKGHTFRWIWEHADNGRRLVQKLLGGERVGEWSAFPIDIGMRRWFAAVSECEDAIRRARHEIERDRAAVLLCEHVELQRLRMSTGRGQLLALSDDVLDCVVSHLCLCSFLQLSSASKQLALSLRAHRARNVAVLAHREDDAEQAKAMLCVARRVLHITPSVRFAGASELERLAALAGSAVSLQMRARCEEARKALRALYGRSLEWNTVSENVSRGDGDTAAVLKAKTAIDAAYARVRGSQTSVRAFNCEQQLCLELPSIDLKRVHAAAARWETFCTAEWAGCAESLPAKRKRKAQEQG